MKNSLFFKKYFSFLKFDSSSSLLFSKNDFIEIQFAFSSFREVEIVRDLLVELNKKFGKNILVFNFLSNSSFSSNNLSSFNFLLFTKSKSAFFIFLNLLFKLNIQFLIISVNSNIELFSISFFKSLINNKLFLDSSKDILVSNFSKTFLLFLKKIEFFNSIRFLKLLKVLRK